MCVERAALGQVRESDTGKGTGSVCDETGMVGSQERRYWGASSVDIQELERRLLSS